MVAQLKQQNVYKPNGCCCKNKYKQKGDKYRIWSFAWWKYDMERFAVTPCYAYLYMSWEGCEKNRWFQLDVSISMLWSEKAGIRGPRLQPHTSLGECQIYWTEWFCSAVHSLKQAVKRKPTVTTMVFAGMVQVTTRRQYASARPNIAVPDASLFPRAWTADHVPFTRTALGWLWAAIAPSTSPGGCASTITPARRIRARAIADVKSMTWIIIDVCAWMKGITVRSVTFTTYATSHLV